MNQDIKARWVEALRSGRYSQGKGTLRAPDGSFCCLGVLCDLKDPDGWTSSDSDDQEVWAHHGAVGILPTDVRVWAGLRQDNPEIRLEGANRAIYAVAELNDGTAGVGEFSFAALADLVEAQL